ncbi:MAG: hybrid sensor histidine kinase/response regulator, partial [Planctomycetota bacterium]
MRAALAAFGVDFDDDDDDDDDEALLAQLDGTAASPTIENPSADAAPTEHVEPARLEEKPRKDEPVTAAVEEQVQPAEQTANASLAGSKSESHIRVPLSRLDEMVRLVGEMIINRSAFAQRLGDFGSQIDDLQVALSRLRGVSDDIETRYSIEALKQGDLNRAGLTPEHSSGSNRWTSMLASPHSANGNEAHQEFDELEFDRYNEFHLLARTLSEATSDVGSIARECGVLSGDFDALLGRWQRLTRDAQDRLMQIRMVPLRTAIPRLGRAVRSTASQCGKQVSFVVRGDHTELDKTVLEEIADPLLHLVRNAVDHGVETPEQRLAAGKSEEATLRIEAINQGTQLTLRVEDDGRGLDLSRIRYRAIERGLIAADESLSDDEVQHLIFAPGFSTAEAVTDVSGRGVGMDVVRETVQRLKGTIRLDSTPGKGARFTIILPTTLAVTRALVINSGGCSFAVPMQAIRQISRLDPSNIQRIGDDPVTEIDGRTVRIRKLAETLGLAPQSGFESAMPMLVVESGDRCVALLVDEIEGGQDIVVKSLGDHLRSVPGVIGATIRGDGSVIPILDPAELVGLSRKMMDTSQLVRPSAKRVVNERRRNVMIVDDSVSVRRITASVMRGGGWSVATAKDGVDALEQLAAAELLPNVILLDMEMPRMDGLEFLSNLRSSEEHSNIPVVMVTSRAGDKHRKRAMNAGATEYVVKPFRDDQLLEITARLVDRVPQAVGAS